jgi:dTDP-4-amino-4,6-dideoxygalactose transaminase
MIPVTKPYLPERTRLDAYIDRIYESCWLTNNGQLVKELTERLKEYLGVEHLLLVSNGTLALQVAYRALGITGTALTTPFTFVATTSTLAWEGITPRFVDIDPETFCMDPDLIEQSITEDTSAIVPVHVFGNACEVERIGAIAKKHGLKVVYDAAHAFGVRYKNESILNYGDAATLSFHATKLFHTIEGGAIVFKEKEALERAKLLINFGITGPETIEGIGINAKMNEFQAAMGLAVLDSIDHILEKRSEVWHYYRERLQHNFQLQKLNPHATNNFGYFPVLFENEEELLQTKEKLNENGINPRRYFFPSLDCVNYVEGQIMQTSRNVSSRILCLPVFAELTEESVDFICSILKG